jgi:hypothetical protein
MDRRNFLKMLVGGVATAAAVRMFPFRVFSFPKEVVVPPNSWIGLPYWEDGAHCGTVMGIHRDMYPWGFVESREIDIAMAKRMFPVFGVIANDSIPKDEIHFLTPRRDEFGRITGSRVDKIINIGGV